MVGSSEPNEHPWHNYVYYLFRFPYLCNNRADVHDSFPALLYKNMVYGKNKLTVISDVKTTS